MYIRLAGYDAETVGCDPFSGSGTTSVMTLRLGINGIGIEVDKNHFDYACKRLIQENKKPSCAKGAIFIEGTAPLFFGRARFSVSNRL